MVGKPGGKGQFRRPRRRLEDNIRMYLREMGLKVLGWIYLIQDKGPLFGL
jgi:hypothetical protein